MRILLFHREDQPLAGPWIGQSWDVVFDLGRGGWAAYERWAQAFRCPVQPIDGLNRDNSRTRRVRELLEWGRGHLVDREGIDWWEMTALLIHQQLETLVLLNKFAENVAPGAEVFITRNGFEARALRLLLGDRLQVMGQKAAPTRKNATHYVQRIKRLSGTQILDVLGDKYDGAYRVRRYWHRRPIRQEKPVVLLPSAYVNVSLLGTGYARLAPEIAFLLVSTRRSGRLRDAPPNVEQEWLASYAGESSAEERLEILAQWNAMQQEIGQVLELALLRRLGLMDDFPRRFAEGLAVRDAWRQVFEQEPIQAVLCGDDSNPYTHIPLLLARKRGLPAIVCHHGAFDGRYHFKTNHAEVILAKGKMEWDYLVNVCGVDRAEVEIGAPETGRAPSLHERIGDSIVFFSEPYEVALGRTEEIYRDLLPGLAELAAGCGKKLVVKLHPSESPHDRKSLAAKLLGREEMKRIEWLTGSLNAALLQKAWFGIAVLSSVVLDCVVHGVPCFVCDWLDLWPYGYVAQYRKFGVGIGLSAPEEIAKIPDLLARQQPRQNVTADCWQLISRERLEDLLTGRKPAPAAYGCDAAS
jgi:hypothetical protein